jgi:hypothetical protein
LPVVVAGQLSEQRPALGAGVEIEEILPGEMLDAREADRLHAGFGVLHRLLHLGHQGLGALRHRGQPARRLQVREQHVGDRRDDVEVLGVRQQIQKNQHQASECVQKPGMGDPDQGGGGAALGSPESTSRSQAARRLET